MASAPERADRAPGAGLANRAAGADLAGRATGPELADRATGPDLAGPTTGAALADRAAGADWQVLRAELVHFVVGRVGDPDLEEDIVHDVLVRTLARRGSLREPGKLRPWLYQIARNAARNRRASGSREMVEYSEADEVADPVPDPALRS